MNCVKNYLILALSVAFCTSFQAFAMEKERSSASGEWSGAQPIGEANISGESGINERDKELLEAQIGKFRRINDMINNHLLDNYSESSNQEYIELEQLQQITLIILGITREMYLGLRPVDMRFVNQQIYEILQKWDRLSSY